MKRLSVLFPLLIGLVSNGADVREFGARGDGKADDTTAFQRAVDSKAGDIWIPRGVYRLTRTIVIPLDNVGPTSVVGSGTAKIVMEGRGPAFKFVGTHNGTADPKTVENRVWKRQRTPVIDGIEIVGGHAESEGIEASGTMQLTISRVVVRKALHGIHLTVRNRNVIISDCHLYENRGAGIYLDDVNLHQINISNCHVSYNAAGGIVARAGNVRNIQITGCDIEGNMPPESGGASPAAFHPESRRTVISGASPRRARIANLSSLVLSPSCTWVILRLVQKFAASLRNASRTKRHHPLGPEALAGGPIGKLTEDELSRITQIIDRKGGIAGIYNKNHPVMEEEHDKAGILCGKDAPIIECDFGTVAGIICFDLGFAPLLEKYTRAKPDLLIFSSMYHGGAVVQSWWAYSCRAHFVSAVAGLPSEIRDPYGQVLATTTNYRDYAVGTVNLDCCMTHYDYNWEKLEALKRKYGVQVTILDPGYFGSVLISSETDEITATDMAKEFEIELLDDYLARELARHSDVRMTMRYTHIGIKAQSRAVATIPSPWQKAAGVSRRTSGTPRQHLRSTSDVPARQGSSSADNDGQKRLREKKATIPCGTGGCGSTSQTKAKSGGVCQDNPKEWRRRESNPRPATFPCRLLRA